MYYLILVRFLMSDFQTKIILHMERVVAKFSVLFLLFFLLVCCNFRKEAKLEPITGKSNEIVVVIGKEIWKGEVGSLINEILTQPQSSLPQQEPLFTLIDVPPEAFINLFKSNGNIIIVKISSTYTDPKVEFTKNTWAYPQAVVNIQSSSPENFKEMFSANGDKIISFFLQAEQERLKETYRDSHEKVLNNSLLKNFNLQAHDI